MQQESENMQNWGDALLIADAYQEVIRRIEKRQAGQGDHVVDDQPPLRPVIRLIQRLKTRSKAAAEW
jgi:hypothetical protein